MFKIKLPKSIQSFIGNNKLHKNKVGQSPSDVFSFEKMGETFYLKMTEQVYANTTYSALREAKILDWLNNKLLVPELILMDKDHENEYMITKAINAKPIEKIKGKKDHFFLDIYQETLKQLQNISIQNCPFHSDKKTRIAEAKYLLDHDLLDELDLDDVDHHVWDEFQDHQQLWQYLAKQDFHEDFVFSHGDITDTNIFLDEKEQIYFLDVGRAGIADRFVDIAFIERSLREDCSHKIARKFIESLPKDEPFKRDFYLKLDELN